MNQEQPRTYEEHEDLDDKTVDEQEPPVEEDAPAIALWNKLMSEFKDKVVQIEDESILFVEKAFDKLRSAQGAFELLQNFRNIQTREAINAQMLEKYDAVLAQYTKEVDLTSSLFHSRKDAPPIYKSYPPVAGAIEWAASLFQSAKEPIMHFRAMGLHSAGD